MLNSGRERTPLGKELEPVFQIGKGNSEEILDQFDLYGGADDQGPCSQELP